MATTWSQHPGHAVATGHELLKGPRYPDLVEIHIFCWFFLGFSGVHVPIKGIYHVYPTIGGSSSPIFEGDVKPEIDVDPCFSVEKTQNSNDWECKNAETFGVQGEDFDGDVQMSPIDVCL